MTHTDDLRERVERASTDLMQDLSALLEEFDLKFDLTKPDRQVRVEQRTINNMFFALLNARAAAGPEPDAIEYCGFCGDPIGGMHNGSGSFCAPDAGPEADWLDAALESVHPEHCRDMQMTAYSVDGDWKCSLVWPRGGDEHGNVDWANYTATGDGPTAAIKDAIATALAAKQEGGER